MIGYPESTSDELGMVAFLAKMMVLQVPADPRPATLWPWLISSASTLSTVSALNRKRLSSSDDTASGRIGVLAPVDTVPLVFLLVRVRRSGFPG